VSFTKSNRQVNEGSIPITIRRGNTTTQEVRNLTYKWDEQNIEAGLRIPLVLTRSRFISNFSFGNSVGVTQISNFNNSITGSSRTIPSSVRNDTITSSYPPIFNIYQGNGNLVYNHFSISTYALLKRSSRDINSKWGIATFFDAYWTPFGGNYSGAQASSYSLFYLPGFFKHHSIWGYGAYQYRQLINERSNYIFRNRIPLPRGISVFSTFQNFYSASANYTLPVWYPDLNIGPLINFQRVRLNGFFDYGYGSGFFGSASTQEYASIGGEIKFDINVIRLLPQFNFGFRYSIGLKPSASLFEVLIGTFNF
jgi:hypothetical protein